MKPLVMLFTLGALAACAPEFEDRAPRVVQAGNFRAELLVAEHELALFFWDRGERPVDGAVVRASALVRSGGREVIVDLVPSGESMRGRVPFVIAPDAFVTVTFSVRNGPVEQADFALGALPKQDVHGY